MKKFKKHKLKHLSLVEVNGYLMVWYPSHPSKPKSGYVYVHRLVMENHLGRFLLPSEFVHHRNEKRHQNYIRNLKLTTNSKHAKLHQKALGNQRLTIKCQRCKKLFTQKRKKQKFCCSKCADFSNRKIIHPETKTLKRLVWKYPRTVLATRFGVSDVAIGNWCKRLGIEMPGIGYWKSKTSKGG